MHFETNCKIVAKLTLWVHLTAGSRSFVVSVPVLADYVEHQAELLEGAQFLFELYKAGAIKVEIAKKVLISHP